MKGIDILKMRQNLDMTQEEFGKLLGVTRKTIINWEQGGGITATTIARIERMLAEGIGDKPINKISLIPRKSEVNVETYENLRQEILDLKDHIKTLKELIDEKNKIAEMHKIENSSLKQRIEDLEK
jgi:DNA-binding XRE family transcriptional regulator